MVCTVLRAMERRLLSIWRTWATPSSPCCQKRFMISSCAGVSLVSVWAIDSPTSVGKYTYSSRRCQARKQKDRDGTKSSRRIAQHCRYQLRIHVLSNLFEFAVMQANHKTIRIVIWLARPGGIVAARFHYNIVAFSNETVANGFDPAINPRPQLAEQPIKDFLFALVLS